MAAWTVSPTTPLDNAIEISINPTFVWAKVDNGDPEPRVRLIVSKVVGLTDPILDKFFNTEETYTLDSFDLDNDTDYYWAVAIEGDALPTARKFTTATVPPTLNSPVDGTTDVAFLPTCYWTANDSSTLFDLQLSEHSDFLGSEGVDQWTYSSVNAEFKLLTTSLPSSTLIYWRVRATDGTTAGGWTTGGESFTTTSGVPSAPVLDSPADTDTDVSLDELFQWTNSGGATNFDIYIDTNIAFPDPTIVNTEDTSYRATSGVLENSTTYYWKVVGKNVAGSTASSTRSFTTIAATTPSKPIPISPIGEIDTNIPLLSWGASTGATRYHVQVSTVSTFASIVEEDVAVEDRVHQILTELSLSTLYYWRVRGLNEDLGGSWSDTVSFTTVDSVTGVQPSAPSWVYPVNGSDDIPVEPTLDWSDTTNTDSWDLEVFDENSNMIIGTSILYAAGSDFTIPTAQALDYGKTYSARVRSVNMWGVSAWVITSFTTINTLEQTPPVITYPTNGDVDIPDQFLMTWTFAFDSWPGVSYRVQMSSSPSFSNILLDQSGIVPLQLLIDLPGTSYNYWVRVMAITGAGNTNWSTVHEFSVANTTAPDKPVISHPISGSTDVNIPTFFDWVGNSYNTEWYEIQIATENTFAPENLVFKEKEIDLMSITVPGLLYETEYFVRVRGFNTFADGGYGLWSDTVDFTTNDDTLPGFVQLIAPPNNDIETSTLPVFQWAAADYADSYTLEVFSSTDFVPVNRVFVSSGITALTYTIPGASELDKQTTYYWRVRAFNHMGYGNWMYWAFTTEVEETPTQPTLVLPENYTGETRLEPLFTWTEEHVTTAVKYLLEIATDSAFSSIIYQSGYISSQELDYSLRDANTPTINTALEYYGRYYWRVRGVNDNDTPGVWADYFTFVVMDIPAPLQPVITTPVNGAIVNKTSTITFIKGLYSDTSLIEICRDGTFRDPVISEEIIGTTLEVTLYYGKTYYLRIHGIGRGGFGEYSEDMTFIIQDIP